MLALNISAAMPALLKPRFSSPAAAFMRTVLLCVICLFPIVPDFVQTFLLSFAAFLIYIFVFYDEGTEKTAAFSVIFFSIIGSWSYLTTWWIQRISSSALPLWLPPVVALLLTALALLYFSILRAYFRIVSESMVLGSFTERMWNYATFMAASPSVLILTLVVSPPRNLLILQLLTFFAIAASTIIFPMLYQMGRSARLAEENSRLMARSEYYQGVESQQQEIRKLKHDLMNHLTVIATYIDLGENEKAMEYLKEIGTRFAEMTKQYTPSTLINAILNSKKQKADAHGLSMGIIAEISSLPQADEMDLCTLIANALDNAIEADPPDKRIEVTLLEDDGHLLLTVANRYSGSVEMESDGSFITHKSDKANHGFGIRNIREAAARMGGNVSITASDGTFRVEAEVPLAK